MLLLGFAPTRVLSHVLLVALLVRVVAGRKVRARVIWVRKGAQACCYCHFHAAGLYRRLSSGIEPCCYRDFHPPACTRHTHTSPGCAAIVICTHACTAAFFWHPTRPQLDGYVVGQAWKESPTRRRSRCLDEEYGAECGLRVTWRDTTKARCAAFWAGGALVDGMFECTATERPRLRNCIDLILD